MDDFVRNKLTEWGLSEWIDRFKDEGIDKESLYCLNDHDIEQLFPKVGLRAIFRKKLQLLKEHEAAADFTQVQPSTSHTGDKGKKKLDPQGECQSPTTKRQCDTVPGENSEEIILGEVTEIMEKVRQNIQQGKTFNTFLTDKIRDLETDKRELVGVFGKTGAGKSSLINAVIGEENLLPSGSGSACTSAMIKVEANVDNQNYEAEIEFITKEDWREELWNFDKFLKEDGCDDGDDDDEYREKLSALYGEGWEDKSPDELMDKNYFREIPEFLRSEKKMLTGKSAEDLSEKLIQYTRREKDRQGCYWPLVKCVTVKVPNKKLLQHVTLVDLPGNGDCNKGRDEMWKKLVASCSTVWIVTEMNRAADEKEAWEILESACSLMGNGGECQQIHFICTKSDLTEVSKARSTDEARNLRFKENEQTKRNVRNNFNQRKKIQKHFEQDRFTVFMVSSKEFLQGKCLNTDENEIPKLQKFLQELNDCHSENLNYVSGAHGILSLIEGARSGQVTGKNGDVCTALEESMRLQLDKIREPIKDAYEAFEKCLSEGVKNSKDSCEKTLKSFLYPKGKGAGSAFHKTLKCVVVNNGTHKPKKKKQINLNAKLASWLTDSIDEEFKKTFPNDRRCGPFNGVISEFSLDTQGLIQKYKDFELQLTFLKTEEEKIKTKLHNIIRDKKKTIYSSLTELIKNSMQECYKRAAEFRGKDTLKNMRDTLETHVRDSKNTMFENAKDDMLAQLNQLKENILKTLEETMQTSIELSLKTDDAALPDFTTELEMVKKYHNILKCRAVKRPASMSSPLAFKESHSSETNTGPPGPTDALQKPELT